MGLIKIIVIVLAVAFISGAVKAFLVRRHNSGRFLGKKQHPDFISEELYKLNELKNRGILTDEEYRRQKAKLLNR